MNPPSAPFRSLPLPSAPFAEGHEDLPSAPFPSSPPLGGGRGSGRGSMTKRTGSVESNSPLPLPFLNGALPDEGFWPPVPISEVADAWAVLRCASAHTIVLAEEVRSEKLLGWAPIIRVQKRLPRRRKTELIVRPLLPSFLFVAAEHTNHVLDLAERGRIHQCKRFLVNAGEVVVPGFQLSPLHLAQIRGTLRKRPLAPGDRVEILATVLYLVKAVVLRGPMRNDSYEVEIEGQKQAIIFPGFLLRKTLT